MNPTNITTNTVTTIDLPQGRHLVEIYGTWDSVTVNIRHKGSEQSFSGLSALTATPSSASVIMTGGESVEIVTTGGGASLSLSARISGA